MSFIRVKTVKDAKYYYLVESYRDDGKVKQRILAYYGTTLPSDAVVPKQVSTTQGTVVPKQVSTTQGTVVPKQVSTTQVSTTQDIITLPDTVLLTAIRRAIAKGLSLSSYISWLLSRSHHAPKVK